MPSRLRSSLANAALLAGSVLLALALGEAMVRWARPEYVDPYWLHQPGFYRYDPELGWAHVPGSVGSFSRREFTHPVHINAAGWRDRERSRDRPPGVYRVVMLGDSFPWGHGVPDEEIVNRRMEALMPGVEVLNMALSGSATDQQLLILKEHALPYHPDLVVVMVSRNDFTGILLGQDGPYAKPRFLLDPDGSLHLTNVPVPQPPILERLNSWLRRTSGLVHMIESTWEAGRPPDRPTGKAGRLASYALMRALLVAMRDACAEYHARLAIAIVPSNAHTYYDPIPALELERTRTLGEIGEAAGIPVLDLVPAFKVAARDPATGQRIDLHYRLDQHWNALGHEVAAKELSRLIEPIRAAAGQPAGAPMAAGKRARPGSSVSDSALDIHR